MSTSLPPGLKGFPVSKYLCFAVIAVPILASLTSTKYVFFYAYDPFISQYHQFWRLLTVQLAFINESEVFMSTLLLYQFRNLERLFGSRKYLSLIVIIYLYTLLTVSLLAAIKFYTDITWLNAVSSGPTSVMFALLANHREYIPVVYRFELYGPGQAKIVLTDQFLVFLLSFQLSVAQGINSVCMGSLGWILGDLVSRGLIPGKLWRIPYWAQKERREETPVPLAEVEAAEDEEERAATETRPLASQFLDTFRR